MGVAPQAMRISVSPFDIFDREVRIQGSYLNPFAHGRAADLVSSGVSQAGSADH